MRGVAMLIIYPVIEFDGLEPIVDARLVPKNIVTAGFGGILLVFLRGYSRRKFNTFWQHKSLVGQVVKVILG